MNLHGNQLVGGVVSADGLEEFFGFDPTTGNRLEPPFIEATQAEVDAALAAALGVRQELKTIPAAGRASLLDAIAIGIEALGDELLDRAQLETGLPKARLANERGRTCAQLRMFADIVREGSWVAATIDHADPDREPLPKPDLRRMLRPIGPVVIFGASNFPLAFSVAGGDTASALAAGCPVIVKAHPNHPGTSELVGETIRAAVRLTEMPAGMFSLLQGKRIETGAALVRHPSVAAVGFTGSLSGGRALFDIAAARAEPIPVYAEMGSTNPVFVLPSALAGAGAEQLAEQIHQAVVLGVGQFCTNPGILVALDEPATESFVAQLAERIRSTPSGTMLHNGIRYHYEEGCANLRHVDGVTEVVPGVPESGSVEGDGRCQVKAGLFATDAETFLCNPVLSEEVFGPSTLVVRCADAAQMQLVADNLPGQLTATVHGDPANLASGFPDLMNALEQIAGRVILNSVPTGVEVCAAMHHGGPYPATTDSRSTSVGHAAIQRFARPVCYQGMVSDLLPSALRDANPDGLLRFVDGTWTREPS